MFGRVSEIPIANTLSELVGMGFVDFGEYAAFLHAQGTFSRFSVVVFRGTEKGAGTAEMVLETVISHWSAVSGAPDILIVDKDM